jgi:hypothetical protein
MLKKTNTNTKKWTPTQMNIKTNKRKKQEERRKKLH